MIVLWVIHESIHSLVHFADTNVYARLCGNIWYHADISIADTDGTVCCLNGRLVCSVDSIADLTYNLYIVYTGVYACFTSLCLYL